MSAKKKIAKKKEPKKDNALDTAMAELMLAIGSSQTEDKAGLIHQLATMVEQKATGRERRLSHETAEKRFKTLLELNHSPDVSAVFSEEIIELIRMEDLYSDDGKIKIRLNQSCKIKGEEVEEVTLYNLSVKDFIELDMEPYAILQKGGTLKEVSQIVERVIRADEDEVYNLTPGDVNRIWGIFGCFFLGR